MHPRQRGYDVANFAVRRRTLRARCYVLHMPRAANPPPRVPHAYTVIVAGQRYGPFVLTASPNATWTGHGDALMLCPDVAKRAVLYDHVWPSYEVRLATAGEVANAEANQVDA